MPPISLSWADISGACLTFFVGSMFSAFDLFQTLYAKDVRTINLLRCWAIWSFVLLSASVGTVIFLLTCIYPGEWINRVLGQQIENVFGRAVTVGVLVTVLLRSKLANLGGENSLGIDTFYATLPRQALVALNTKSERVFEKAASDFAKQLSGEANPEGVLRQLVQHSLDHLGIVFADDPHRLNRLQALYKRVVQGQTELMITSSAADLDERIKDTILWSFRYAGYNEIRHWLTGKLGGSGILGFRRFWPFG